MPVLIQNTTQIALKSAKPTGLGMAQLGFPVLEARSRAFLLYTYVVGESLMATQGGPSQKQERRRFVEQLMQQPLADAPGGSAGR